MYLRGMKQSKRYAMNSKNAGKRRKTAIPMRNELVIRFALFVACLAAMVAYLIVYAPLAQ